MNASLESKILFEEERIIVAPAGHPIAKNESISVQDLSEYEMMMAAQGTFFRDSLDEELSSAGVEMKISAEVDGLRLLASLAFQGHAPAILPASAASGYPDNNREHTEKSTQEAEKAGIRVVHARTGVVLSSSGGLLKKLLPLFKLGLGGQIGSGKQMMSWIVSFSCYFFFANNDGDYCMGVYFYSHIIPSSCSTSFVVTNFD